MTWQDRAACRGCDGDIFFPNIDTRTRNRPAPERVARACAPAIAICRTCPVKAECLRHAVDHGETEGVWGGMDPLQRRKLGRRKRCARCRAVFEPFGTATYCPDCRPGVRAEYPSMRRAGWPGFPVQDRVTVDLHAPPFTDDDPRSRAAESAYTEGEL